MIELYHSRVSPCAQKVRLVLHEKGIAWESRLLDIALKENLRPEYLALNPDGVVPTLVIDGRPYVESTLICEVLEARHPAPALGGDTADARYEARLWAKLADEKLHPALGALAWAITMRRQFLERAGEDGARAAIAAVPDPVRRGRQARILAEGFGARDVAEAVAVYRKATGRLESALGASPWLGGTGPGLADFFVAPYVQALHQYALDALFLHDRPALAAWFARIRQRPSFDAAIDAWLPGERRALLAGHGSEARAAIGRLLEACD